jgi:hypothetical protein
MNPEAREEGLLVEELSDETLVYDMDRHKAHCLNPTAALVWRHCDGRKGIPELARLLEKKLSIPADERIVWMAVNYLGKAHLLKGKVALPGPGSQYSRRRLMRLLGLTGALLPVVSSVTAPLAVHAATCITNTQCVQTAPPFCVGQPICPPPPNKCCVQKTPTKCDSVSC